VIGGRPGGLVPDLFETITGGFREVGERMGSMSDEKWFPGKATIGSYIRAQRELSKMSLRELARMSQVSNAYLSQIERGLHEPSLRVLAAIAEALSLPLEELMAQARPDSRPTDGTTRRTDAVEAAIRAESRLTQAQKEALLAVYRSYLAESEGSQQPGD
jgi:transcriptional regulator with XRE-family HTH domain